MVYGVSTTATTDSVNTFKFTSANLAPGLDFCYSAIKAATFIHHTQFLQFCTQRQFSTATIPEQVNILAVQNLAKVPGAWFENIRCEYPPCFAW